MPFLMPFYPPLGYRAVSLLLITSVQYIALSICFLLLYIFILLYLSCGLSILYLQVYILYLLLDMAIHLLAMQFTTTYTYSRWLCNFFQLLTCMTLKKKSNNLLQILNNMGFFTCLKAGDQFITNMHLQKKKDLYLT